jgi:hypothetical protein
MQTFVRVCLYCRIYFDFSKVYTMSSNVFRPLLKQRHGYLTQYHFLFK